MIASRLVIVASRYVWVTAAMYRSGVRMRYRPGEASKRVRKSGRSGPGRAFAGETGIRAPDSTALGGACAAVEHNKQADRVTVNAGPRMKPGSCTTAVASSSYAHRPGV